MKLEEIYRRIIGTGMKNDPRSKREVRSVILENRKEYNTLKGRKKEAFDKESLFNPYSDTRILYGDRTKEIETIMVGVDMEAPELLVADRLNRMARPVDLVMSHHPGGRALVELYKVMDLQTARLKTLGIADDVAEELMDERIAEVSRKLHARNCMRSIDVAKILDIPFMCAHTAADNMVNNFLQKLIDRKKPKTIGAVADLLENIYEYKKGSQMGIGPTILLGGKKKLAGRIFVDMTGGTEGSKRVFARLSQIGIGTIICMHLSEEHFKQAKKEHVNVIIAGHIPSDSLGINLILDALIKEDQMHIIPCSGFIRHSRI